VQREKDDKGNAMTFEPEWCKKHPNCWMYPCGHCRAYHDNTEIADCFKYGLNIGGTHEVE